MNIKEQLSPVSLDATHVDNSNVHRYTFHQISIKAHGTIPEGSMVSVTASAKDTGELETVSGATITAKTTFETIRLPEWILDAIEVTGDAAFVAAGCTLTVYYTGFATAQR